MLASVTTEVSEIQTESLYNKCLTRISLPVASEKAVVAAVAAATTTSTAAMAALLCCGLPSHPAEPKVR